METKEIGFTTNMPYVDFVRNKILGTVFNFHVATTIVAMLSAKYPAYEFTIENEKNDVFTLYVKNVQKKRYAGLQRVYNHLRVNLFERKEAF